MAYLDELFDKDFYDKTDEKMRQTLCKLKLTSV